jgi:hypothetical protein
MGDHPRDMGRARDIGDGRSRGPFEGGRPGLDRRAVEHDDERRRWGAELATQERLRPGGFQVIEDEPAGTQPARDLWGERQGGQHDERPGGDHPARASRDEPAKTVEGGHTVIVAPVAR